MRATRASSGTVLDLSGNAWQRLRATPGLGRLADVGMGPRAASRKTKNAGARIAGLKATESVCPYCAVGCAQVVYTRGGTVVDIEGHPARRFTRARPNTAPSRC